MEPYTATSGRLSAAATCIRPESLDTTAVAAESRSIASAIEVDVLVQVGVSVTVGVEVDVLHETLLSWKDAPGDPYTVLELRDGKILAAFAIVSRITGRDSTFDIRYLTRMGWVKYETRTVKVPVPAGLEATAAIFAAVQGLGPDDLVVAPWRACGPWARIRWHACGA